MSKRLLAPADVVINSYDAMLLVLDVLMAMVLAFILYQALTAWLFISLLRIGANA